MPTDQQLREALAHGGPHKMRTIVALTGFSPAILRAWERRYRLLRPKRSFGGHRAYTNDDLQVLLRIRDLYAQGHSIGEIARVGRKALIDQQRGHHQEPRQFEPLLVSQARLDEKDIMVRLRRLVVEAALKVDSSAVNKALSEAFSSVAEEAVVFEVIKPAALEIGDLWAAGRCSVASEHLASGVFVHRMLNLIEATSPPRSRWRPFVVACFPDEYHQLAALMVAYLLTRNGARVSFLGPALPFEDLDATCELVRPTAVLLSVTRSAVFRMHRVRFLETLKHCSGRTPFYLGGQGVPLADKAVERSGARVVQLDRDPQDVIAEILTTRGEQERPR